MRTDTDRSFYSLRRDDKVWLDSRSKEHSIEVMDLDYLLNVLKMLQKRNAILRNSGRKMYIIPDIIYETINKYKETNPEYFL